MLNTLRQSSWWLVVTLVGVSAQGAAGPSATAMVIAGLLKAIAHAIWLSLPQLWRGQFCDQLASIRTKITALFRKRPSNSQEHHHAYR